MSAIRKMTNEPGSVVLREAFDSLRTKDHVNVMQAAGLMECLTDPALYRQYKTLLVEGCSADSAAALDILFDNFQTLVFTESTLSSIQPVSVLTMPMLRKAWPKIGMKEALPTEPVKTPKFTVSYLNPYFLDPTTGVKTLLPQGLKSEFDNGGSQTRILATSTALPMNAFDVLTPIGRPTSAGYTLDPIFSVIGVDIVPANASNAADATQVNVKVYNGQAETRQGNIRFTVSVTAADGVTQSSDTVFGWVDFGAGLVTLTNINQAVGAGLAKITKVYLSGQIETTTNKQSTSVGFDVTTTEIAIGTGEHFDAALPLEWLQDNLALYNIDGTLKVVDIMTEILAQRVDIQAVEFVQNVYNKGAALNATNFARTFDVYPTGNYMGSPTDWLNELRRITDNLAQTMRNFSNFGGGQFVIVGNPIDVALYVGVQWIFTASGDGKQDGVEVNYSIGALSGAQRYAMFSSQNFAAGTMWIFFVPGPEDQKVLTYYPYTFNVERSSSGFVSPNSPNTPSVMMTKRHAMKDFLQIVGAITVLHNDGSLPA